MEVGTKVRNRTSNFVPHVLTPVCPARDTTSTRLPDYYIDGSLPYE